MDHPFLFSELPREVLKLQKKHLKVISPLKNYRIYRDILESCKEQCRSLTPLMNVFYQDLLHLRDSARVYESESPSSPSPSCIDKGLRVNLSLLRMEYCLYEVLTFFQDKCRRSLHDFSPSSISLSEKLF